ALHDPVFRLYAELAGAVLLFAGVVLALMRWVLRKNVTSIWKTYCSWLIMAPLVLGLVWAGRTATIIGFTVVAIFGFKEFARATGLYRDWWMTATVYLGILAVGAVSFIPQPHHDEPGAGWYGMFVALPAFAIPLIMLIPILRNQTQGQLQRMSLAILGFIY